MKTHFIVIDDGGVMYSSIRSAVLLVIVGAELKVECDLAQAKCNFTIVGLADKAINESRERCTAAIFNSGFRFPQKKITINLSPANIKKRRLAHRPSYCNFNT